MKKILKNRIFIFVIALIIGASVSIYATSIYYATDVIYNPSDGESMSVNDALNDLYSSKTVVGEVKLSSSVSAYGDGSHTHTFKIEETGTYLVSVSTAKASTHCTITTSSVSLTGYDTIDILYSDLHYFGWSYNSGGGTQLHLYVAKITATADTELKLNISIGNGYPLYNYAIVKV